LFALCYRSVAFVASLAGVLDTVGVFRGNIKGEMLLFYTTESNVFVVLMFGALLARTAIAIKKEGRLGPSSYFERLSAIVTLAITVTMLIFWGLLAPTITDMAFLLSWANLQIHLLTPLLMLVDYFLFTQAGKMKKQDPWFFALIPLAYFVQATILGFSGYVYTTLAERGGGIRNFPYFFIDFNQLQYRVFLYVAAILVIFLSLAYLLLFYDHRRGKKTRRPPQ
jgi:hypothetical protein